ncbi:hypothetical protein GQ457_12G015520 [Hibiscus cannabinus]
MEIVVSDNVMNDDNIINSDGDSYEEDSEEISDSNNEAKSEKDVVECNYCGKCIAYKPSYETIGIKNHIARCKRFPANLNRKQKLVNFESKTIASPGGTSKIVQVPTCWQFDQDNCRKALAMMLIVDELSFVFVEHEGFRYFCKQLCPKFVPPSRKTVTRYCYSIFIEERSKLKDIFSKLSSRVCLTTDTWTSGQNLGYMCLTAHFIDDQWRFHKKIINFCPIPGHSGEIIGKSIEKCLNEWNLCKILTVTVDNASSNDVAIQYLRRRITHWGGSVLNGQFLHMRCAAHILNLVVKDGLKELDLSIARIRGALGFLRSSPNRLQTFKACMEEENITSKSYVCLDIETRWNSTFLMLETALKFKKAFDNLYTKGGAYCKELRRHFGVPDDDDWRRVGAFLQIFCNTRSPEHDGGVNTPNRRRERPESTTNQNPSLAKALNASPRRTAARFREWSPGLGSGRDGRPSGNGGADHGRTVVEIGGSLHVTSNTYVLQIFGVRDLISSCCGHESESIRKMAHQMKVKHDKYWGQVDNLNILLFVALLLDPRHKWGFVKWIVCDIYDFESANSLLSTIKVTLKALYEFYDDAMPQSKRKKGESSTSSSTPSSTRTTLHGMESSEKKIDVQQHYYNRYRMAKQTLAICAEKTELEKYLSEEVEPNDLNFDILEWWSGSQMRYPVLARMARDVLAIPISTIASESAFSTGGRVLDSFRTSLTPRIAEALICSQDWLRKSRGPLILEENLLELEELEDG